MKGCLDDDLLKKEGISSYYVTLNRVLFQARFQTHSVVLDQMLLQVQVWTQSMN